MKKLINKIVAAVAVNVIFAIAPAHAGDVVYKEIDMEGTVVTYAAYGGEPMNDEQKNILNAVDMIFKEIKLRKAKNEGSSTAQPVGVQWKIAPSMVSVASLNTRSGRVTTGVGMGLSIGGTYQKDNFSANFGVTTTPLFYNTGYGVKSGKVDVAQVYAGIQLKF